MDARSVDVIVMETPFSRFIPSTLASVPVMTIGRIPLGLAAAGAAVAARFVGATATVAGLGATAAGRLLSAAGAAALPGVGLLVATVVEWPLLAVGGAPRPVDGVFPRRSDSGAPVQPPPDIAADAPLPSPPPPICAAADRAPRSPVAPIMIVTVSKNRFMVTPSSAEPAGRECLV